MEQTTQTQEYAHLYESAPVGYFCLDAEGKIVKVNCTGAAQLGPPRDTLIGQPLERYILEEDQETYLAHLQSLNQIEDPQICAVQLVKNDGTVFNARLESTKVRDAALTSSFTYLIIVSNVTERTQHSEKLEDQVTRRTAALRISQARFRVIFEDAALGIVLLNDQGYIMQSNPAFQKMLGMDKEILEDRSLDVYLHSEDKGKNQELFTALMQGQRELYKAQVRFVIKNEVSPMWANLTASLVRGFKGQPRLAIMLIEDITEQREAQEALVQTEKLALTGRLAASLAHEINNPLQTVIGCLGLAEELREEEDIGIYLQMASEELQRAAGIVSRLRDVSHPSDPGDQVSIDVGGLIEQVLLLTRKQCQNHRVEVSVEIASDLPRVLGVPDRLQQVFLNLVLNALDAMPSGGILSIKAERESPPLGIKLTFADSGSGIAPQILSEIFAPFNTTKPEGLGLGLFISQSIIEAHGGHIDVESVPGNGAVFTIWLPAQPT